MDAVLKRIERLERFADDSNLVTVTFKDGTKRRMKERDCILLAKDNEAVKHFDGQGVLTDLLNGLLD